MKITTEKFKNAITKALLCPVDTHLSDYAGEIKILAENNKFIIVVANIKGMAMKVTADCEGTLDPITVNALKLRAIANNIDEIEKEEEVNEVLIKVPTYVDLSIKDKKLVIKYEKSKHSLMTRKADTYDDYVKWLSNEESNCEVSGDFGKIMKRISTIPNPRDIKQDYISVGIKDNEVVATNGYKLAVIKTDITGQHDIRAPLDTVKILENLSVSKLYFTDKNIQAEGDDFIFQSRLTEGTNVNYSIFTGVNNDYYMVVNRSKLISTLKKINTTVDEEAPRANITITKDKMFLTSIEEIGNESSSEIDLEECTLEEDFIQTVNSKHLLDMLNFFSGDKIKIQIPSLKKEGAKFLKVQEENAIYINALFIKKEEKNNE